MDMVLSGLEGCRNTAPGGMRSRVANKAGYAGPIAEIFSAPFMVVVGTKCQRHEQRRIQAMADFFQKSYRRHFHGAECVVKKDHEVGHEDLAGKSLVLIGNPGSNGVWARIQADIPLAMTSTTVSYNNEFMAENSAFEVILPHPYSPGNHVLLIGATDLRYLPMATAASPFKAWYDCVVFGPARRIIPQLGALGGASSLLEEPE